MQGDPVGTGTTPTDRVSAVRPVRSGRGAGRSAGRSAARDSRPPTFLLVMALTVTALCLIPLGFIVVSTLTAGWDTVQRLVFRARVGELLVNTGLLVVLSCTATAVLGTAAAYLVERLQVAGYRVWGPLLVAPLAIPAFVTSYGWVSVFPGIDGLFGATLIMTLAYFPFVYLPVAAALRGLDPAWEEQARTLGLRPRAVFLRVVLPQLRPAILGGAMLVGLHCLSEFGAFSMLRFSTFTTAIYDQYSSSFASAAANMLAVVLVACCLILVTSESWLAGRARRARLGSGAARRPEPMRLGRRQIPAQAFLVVLVSAALAVPLSSVMYWLVRGSGEWSQALTTSVTTIGLAATGAVATVVLAFPVAYLSVRYRSVLTTTMERLSYLAGALPSIVVALALITVTIRFARPIYQSVVTLIAAYVLLFLPRAMVTLRSALLQAPPELEDAARALGVTPAATLARVVLPLAAPGIFSAAALVFIAGATELTATLLLGPIGTTTLATRFWSLTGSIDYVAAAPYAAMMILISAPVTYLLLQKSRKVRGR
jgi:iron(III) transport system permease protein